MYEVTIGIPVYNVERYIRLTMDSALAQTFASIEFLICDDCGTDGSIDIVREYQQHHPRGKDIRILRQPQNMGIGAARNRMLQEAQGRYFYSLDADDAITPNAIELLWHTAQEHQAEIVYGSYERVFVDDGQEVGRRPYPYKPHVFTEEDIFADYVYHVGIQGMNWNYLLSMDVVRRNHLRVTEVGHGYGEDFTFTIDLPTYIVRAVLLPDITYHYFNRDVGKPKRKKKVLSRRYMELAIKAIDDKKRRDELRGKRYYSKRISHLMMLDCSFACEMVGRRAEFDQPFSNREVRAIMWHPMSFWQIVTARSGRFHNLLYWTFGVVPPFLCAWMLRPMMNRYGVDKRSQVRQENTGV
ncbi:MAG: glycosyltransferase family 2 protein [Prevotella sp.]|nr:glycosyltransferase family 2 protein [Prevotella sp.]